MNCRFPRHFSQVLKGYFKVWKQSEDYLTVKAKKNAASEDAAEKSIRVQLYS